MCGHKQIGIWEVSKLTVVDSNDVVNHWFIKADVKRTGKGCRHSKHVWSDCVGSPGETNCVIVSGLLTRWTNILAESKYSTSRH